MLITRTDPFTGITLTKDFPTVEPERLAEWEKGGLIQNIFPELDADEREFILMGRYSESWDAFVGDVDFGG